MAYVADQKSLLITAITMLVAAKVSVGLRYWVRYRQRTSLNADDWCALAAGVVFLANNVTMCWAISEGYMDADPATLNLAQLEISLKLVFIGIFLMSNILTFCRFSVLLF
ncbi:hypothetical protein DM02DRAFT_651807 [Periconia macrospinosa]|uniref:Rhodopsin domain-containing protein n=1 Tax=Periconia macrospinosa TaxID=97972 RepID=A0A2V1E242_9PLEO|nr:hypothetical protein DM02DRAFT_651807 [Periconia macrospinosa]